MFSFVDTLPYTVNSYYYYFVNYFAYFQSYIISQQNLENLDYNFIAYIYYDFLSLIF